MRRIKTDLLGFGCIASVAAVLALVGAVGYKVCSPGAALPWGIVAALAAFRFGRLAVRAEDGDKQ